MEMRVDHQKGWPRSERGWRVFWAGFAVALLLVAASYGAPVNLIAYVTYSLLNSGGTPLSDGSYVMIFGSTDAINNGPTTWGAGNIIADSVQGDDVYLGYTRIDMPSYNGSNGTFYTAGEIWFDDAVIHYLYIRFFDSTNYPISGVIAWNTSTIIETTSRLGQVEMDFLGNIPTSVTNSFVVIPEPSSASLFVLFAGLMLGMRASMKRAERERTPREARPPT
jgi:hypothetical protein